jgi:uncharacterized protein (DUF1501 family)
LFAYGSQENLIIGEQCLVFIQLNGGNDGLNTFVPFDDPLYYNFRPNIGLAKDIVVGKNKGMAFNPALKDFATMQQNGDLSVIQNVGYPEPVRSHFRSQEIWQTASSSKEYLDNGWLGRYLDKSSKENNPTAGINLDSIDNLALKGEEPNSITVKDPNKFKIKWDNEDNIKLSDNPQLDFVRKIANSVTEGSDDIQKALAKSTSEISYPKTGLSKNLEWIARLIKGNLNSKVYYTSLGSFDTHDNQLTQHKNKLTELNDAIYSFYTDLKNAKGTDHGTAAPMFIIGGNNKGKIIGNNPNLSDLENGDLKHEIDFRSIYATLLKDKLSFDYTQIGIQNKKLEGLF